MLATVEQVAGRVGEPITSPEEVALAEAMIEYASEQALFYGDPRWQEATLPGVVRTIIIEAAATGYMHPSGLSTERADSVNFTVHDDWLKGAEFSEQQVEIVRRAGRRRGRTRSLSTRRSNRFVSRADADRHPWFMKVPHAPSEDVAWRSDRLDAFAFNYDGEDDG